MLVLLYGPPGSGKSTLVRLAQQRGLIAVDLEDVFPGSAGKEIRRKAGMELATKYPSKQMVIVGTADVWFDAFPPDSLKILLLPPREIYNKRLRQRDKDKPFKAGQGGIEVYEKFKQGVDMFDVVLGDEMSAEGTLDRILASVR